MKTKRCPNGSRKNIITGDCEQKKQTSSESIEKFCQIAKQLKKKIKEVCKYHPEKYYCDSKHKQKKSNR